MPASQIKKRRESKNKKERIMIAHGFPAKSSKEGVIFKVQK